MIFYEGFHTWEQAELALKETPGPSYVIGAQLIGTRPLADLTAMGQAIEAVPFVLPGVHEVWRLLLDIKEAGDGRPFAAYVKKMGEANGTPYEIGWGDRARPALSRLRHRRGGKVPAG